MVADKHLIRAPCFMLLLSQ